MIKCPKCAHVRNPKDDPQIPETQCPACGVIYEKINNPTKSNRPRPKPAPKKAAIDWPGKVSGLSNSFFAQLKKLEQKKPLPPERAPTENEKLLAYQELSFHKTNHLLHFFISIITLGLWVIPWFIQSANNTGIRNKIRTKYYLPLESDGAGISIKVFMGLVLIAIFSYKIEPPINGVAIEKKPPVKRNWIYSKNQDEMGQGLVHFATNESLNTVNFDFPYQGEQRATLSLIHRPDNSESVLIMLDNAHFLCHEPECYVSISFDSEKPNIYRASRPESRNTNALIINDETRFIKSIIKSKTLKIETLFYKSGYRVFSFDTHALTWNHPPIN